MNAPKGFIALTAENGGSLYFAVGKIAAVETRGQAATSRAYVSVDGEYYAVREQPDEILRLIEEAAHPTTDAACAALVEAARKAAKGMFRARTECEWHEASQALLAALAAMEAPHEPAEVVVRPIESAARPAADADYAPLVDAARRMVTWADDAWTGRSIPEHERIVEAIRAAIAALPAREPRDGNVEVPRG